MKEKIIGTIIVGGMILGVLVLSATIKWYIPFLAIGLTALMIYGVYLITKE